MTENTTETPIQTAAPEHEPDYVGSHSTPTGEQCANYDGEYVEDVERCSNHATHTVVMRSPNGTLSDIPSCDDCGEPEDAVHRLWFLLSLLTNPTDLLNYLTE